MTMTVIFTRQKIIIPVEKAYCFSANSAVL
uniref:Uncharacterized protein n=1 Tax=Anguilla anguilla TaxID=7936 RepID=A0A0E9U025_ANGAN